MRWVKASCGNFEGGLQQPNINPKYDMPNEQDSYLLALAWLPGFCEVNPNKPKCKETAPNAVQAQRFTLHGDVGWISVPVASTMAFVGR